MIRMRAAIAAVVLAAMCLGAGSQAFMAGAQTAKVARDPELIDAAGYARILAANRGAPLVVTFWATWCEPCRDEYPMLNELAKQYGTQGLKVVGVSLDDDGDLILVRRFLARYKPVFPNYRKKPGSETEFAQFRGAVLAGWSGSLPVTLFFAKDGRTVGKVMGEGTRETYEANMKALLAGN